MSSKEHTLDLTSENLDDLLATSVTLHITYAVIILIKAPPGYFAHKDAYKFTSLVNTSVQDIIFLVPP